MLSFLLLVRVGFTLINPFNQGSDALSATSQAPQQEATDNNGLSRTTTAATERVSDDSLAATMTPTATAILITPTPTIQPPQSRPPTATPLALVVSQQGFAQAAAVVSYAFVVRNPNPTQSIQRTRYQVAAYDANGIVLGINSGVIAEIGPRQDLGIAQSIQIPPQVVVNRVEVQLRDGQAVEEPSPPAALTVTNPSLLGGDQPSLTGTVNNGMDRDVENIIIFGIAYNGENIVGGGSTQVSFVSANGQAPVSIPVVTNGEVTHAAFWVVLDSGNEP